MIRLTPHLIVAAYDFLRECHPLKGWKLPHSDGVEFRTDRRPDVFAEHNYRSRKRKPPLIRLSLATHGHLDTVLQSTAHEMCHLAQVVNGEREGHGETFEKRARSVCRQFGWDERAF